jgi:signal transduction histidine kinase
VDGLLATVALRFDWRARELRKRLAVLAADGLHVAADRLRLEQAVGNLVDNALRHGGDEVVLRADAIDGAVELHVCDNGSGFPEDFLGRAFDRFSRSDSARGGEGSGLGLAIVRTIAEAHRGRAHVTNGEHGADAWLSLPIVHDRPATTRVPVALNDA